MRFPVKIKLPNKLLRTYAQTALKLKRARPDILIFGGIFMGVTTVFVAIKDTWDNKDLLIEDTTAIETIKVSELAPDQKKVDLAKARRKLYADAIRAYWKTAVGGGTSVVMILCGRKDFKRQIAELGAMYATLLEAYRQYRRNVYDDLGAEKDQQYAYGLETVEAVDAETGEVSTRVIQQNRERVASPYARWLNEGVWDAAEGRWVWENRLWTSNKLELEARLRSVQSECNDILHLRGFMTLNEVYFKLGFPLTKEGQHVGWVDGGFTDGSAGDSFIDFGVFPEFYGGKYQLPVNREFLKRNSNQNAPLLDFNVTCLDKVWDNVYEYDNRSPMAYELRKTNDYAGSEESLDRWFKHAEYMNP